MEKWIAGLSLAGIVAIAVLPAGVWTGVVVASIGGTVLVLGDAAWRRKGGR